MVTLGNGNGGSGDALQKCYLRKETPNARLGIQIKAWKASRRRKGGYFLEFFKKQEKELKIEVYILSQPFILVAFLLLMLHHHKDHKL